MPQQVAAIRSVSKAYKVIKEMNSQGVEWGEDYRFYSRMALKQFLEGRMKANLDSYLEEMAVRGEEDRRNGRYSRHLLTELGDVELEVPRTRRYSALKVVRAYARRAKRIDQMILSCFVLGISTRKVAEALFPVLGERVSASTVSRVGKRLDQVVKAFHRRPLKDQYRVLVFVEVLRWKKRGLGAFRSRFWLFWGIGPNGKKRSSTFGLLQGKVP